MNHQLINTLASFSIALLSLTGPSWAMADDPPYGGTVYVDPNWITADDPSTFSRITPIGVETVTMYDRRITDWVEVNAHSFSLGFLEGVSVIARVNPEFDASSAESLASKWGYVLGHLPNGLVQKLGELHIQGGDELMGGNGFSDPTHLLVHEEHAARNLSNGWAEEEILHELAHAVFQPRQTDADWIAAQNSDPCYISNYARDYPDREDIAETLAPYLMMKLRPDRVSAADSEAILKCIGARSQVLDAWFTEMGLSYAPMAAEESDPILELSLEEPIAGEIHMGVGNLRGWAVSSTGIARIEVLVDGVPKFDAPYGGNRADVGGAFPEVANSSQSGFSLAYNYSGLSLGQHTITAIAHTVEGETLERSATFEVVRFGAEFIPDADAVDLNGSVLTATDNEITITDVNVDGEIHDLKLKWRPAEQGFEIIEIR